MKKRIAHKISENRYFQDCILIILFIVIGYTATISEDNNLREIYLGIAMLGVLGFFSVIISIIEAKKTQSMLIIVFDLLLVITIYALVFSLVYSYNHQAFVLPDNGVPYLDLLYFSFVTFTTLGYGDVLPVSYIAKFISVSESFMFACILAFAVLNFSDKMKKSIAIYQESDKDNNETLIK